MPNTGIVTAVAALLASIGTFLGTYNAVRTRKTTELSSLLQGYVGFMQAQDTEMKRLREELTIVQKRCDDLERQLEDAQKELRRKT